MPTQKSFKKGDKVSWNSSQGKVQGTVQKKVISTTKVKGHTAKATAENPEYVVKSDKTKKEAIHRPSEFTKK